MFRLEPGRADAAHRPAAAEHIEGGGDLGQVGDVAVGDAGHERAERGRGRVAGEESHGGPAVEHLVPVAAGLGNLDEVVHDPDAGEAGVLAGAGSRRESSGNLSRTARPGEAGDLQAEVEGHGGLLLTSHRVGSRHEFGVDGTRWSCGVDGVEPSSGSSAITSGQRRS
ncbi:MAG: hypothetical protein M3066_07970 [Actinomycetota bacterium]|nr:hypothetical protein [Actinomycetota bacterium]